MQQSMTTDAKQHLVAGCFLRLAGVAPWSLGIRVQDWCANAVLDSSLTKRRNVLGLLHMIA